MGIDYRKLIDGYLVAVTLVTPVQIKVLDIPIVLVLGNLTIYSLKNTVSLCIMKTMEEAAKKIRISSSS